MNWKTLIWGLLLLFAGAKSHSQLLPKSHWENLSVVEGLIDNDVRDVLIEDNSNVWIATARGLSHYDGVSFTNYNLANSNLLNVDIFELEFAQNKLWLRTFSGISSFDGATFVNYTTANGLLTDDVLSMASTSDTLWITSLSGTSKFDGTSFTHYPGITGRDIELDSAGNVFVLRFSVANNFPFAEVYHNGSWSRPNPTGGVTFASSINSAQLKKTADNELFITGSGGFYVKVTYPLHLERQVGLVGNQVASSLQADLSVFEELNGVKWAGTGRNTPAFLFASEDSLLERQYISNPVLKPSCIDAKSGILAVGSTLGVYITEATFKKGNRRVPFRLNEIATSVQITDPLFSNLETNTANFEFPKDSGTHGIYSANIVVVAKKSNEVNYDFHPRSPFVSSFVPGPINNTGGLTGNFIVKISEQEINDHRLNYTQSNYVVPKAIQDWPAYGDTALGIASDLAPFIDFNSNGCYDPENGDYPIIKGDEAIYWINHPDKENIELEYHWMLYGFNTRSDTSLNRTLFIQYTMINRANQPYDSVYLGLFVDGDLGNGANDYVGTDSVNDILYFYNGTLSDVGFRGINGYGNNTPSVGVKFLSDKLSRSIQYTFGLGPTGDPINTLDWRNYLRGLWRDGRPIQYGGDGYSVSGNPTTGTTHMYTGNPFLQTDWTELTLGSGLGANFPGERRILGSVAPFILLPNERRTFEFAVGVGRTVDTTSQIGQNISEMVKVLNDADGFWNTILSQTPNFATTDSCSMITFLENMVKREEKGLHVYPVPTTNELTVESREVITTMQLLGINGKMLLSIQPNQRKVRLTLSDFPEGVYILRVQNSKSLWEHQKIMIAR